MGGKQGKENPLDSANEINVLLLVWLAKDAFLHQRRPLKKSEECFVMDRTQKKNSSLMDFLFAVTFIVLFLF